MSRYECGSNTRKFWVYQVRPGVWITSPPITADGPNPREAVFATHREALDHFIVTQRSLAANRLALLLAGGAS